VIHDLETGEQKEIKITKPWKCSASQHLVAVTTPKEGLHLFSTEGILVHIIPDSTDAKCAAFHPHNHNILAIGFRDGTVRMWNVVRQACVSSLKQHTDLITNIRFVPDCRLFLSSWDDTASAVSIHDEFVIASLVKFKGHANRVFDILPFPSSNKCVTCSYDETIKVWDCENGACLRTLTGHSGSVYALAMHPDGQYFASGSFDHSIIIWSTRAFEILFRVSFTNWIESLVFGESDTVYAGVYKHGIMSCSALTGVVGREIISGTGSYASLTFGMTCASFYSSV
jgi:WD40 repeat protein